MSGQKSPWLAKKRETSQEVCIEKGQRQTLRTNRQHDAVCYGLRLCVVYDWDCICGLPLTGAMCFSHQTFTQNFIVFATLWFDIN